MIKECKAKIMWVDDEKELLEAGKAMLFKEGYCINTFVDSFDALEDLKRHDYDLLITDMVKPEMSGMELLRIGREIRPQIITMVVSGTGQQAQGLEGVAVSPELTALGCIAVIGKPFTMEQLLPKLEKALKQAQTMKSHRILKDSFLKFCIRCFAFIAFWVTVFVFAKLYFAFSDFVIFLLAVLTVIGIIWSLKDSKFVKEFFIDS